MAAVGALASNAIGFRPGPGRHVKETIQGRAKTNETWKTGAVLARDTGELAEAVVDAVGGIVGIAAENVTAATSNLKTIFWPIYPGDVWEATLENQATAGYTLVEADLYTDYGLNKDSNEIWYIDQSETVAANTVVMIIGVKNDSDIGTVRARVYCVFLSDVLALDT